MGAKTVKGITVEINGKATGLGKVLEEAKKKSIGLSKELKEVNKALKLDPSNTTLLTEKQNILGDAVKAAKEELDILKDAQEQVTKQYEAGDIDRGAYLEFQLQLQKAQENLKNLEQQQERFGEVAENSGKKAKRSLEEIASKVSEVGEKTAEVGEKISTVGDGITKGVTVPIMAVGTAATAAFSAVDEGTDTIIKATGATGEALAGLQASYEKVASSMPAELNTVAAAIGEVNTRFHTTGAELEKQTTLMVEFAEITGGDVVSATDAADKALKAWGKDSADLSGFLGMVAQKAQDTGINAEKLMQDVQENSASFKELGFTLEESINFMAQLDANGVDASTVLSGLKKAVVNLTDAGMAEDEALRQVIESIKTASTETEALELAQEIFGTKGAAEMATAIREGRIDLDALADSMGSYESVVGNTFSATISGQDEAKTAANAGKIALAQFGGTISGMLAPVILQLTGILNGATEKLKGMDKNQKKAIVTAALVVAAIGPIISILGKLTHGVGSVITFGGKVISMGPQIVSGFTSVAGFMSGALTTAISGVSAAFSFLAANPIILIIAAIAALVAGLVTAYNKCEWFRDGVNNAVTAVKTAWTNGMEAVKNAASSCMEAAKTTVQQKLDNIHAAYVNNGGGIKGAAAAAMEGVKGYFTLGLSFVDNLTGGKLSSIASAFSTKLGSAKASVFSILDNIKGAFFDKIEGARKIVSQGIENIKNCFNFSWKLPDIKLPHFSVSGGVAPWGFGGKGSLPKISVSWYREGGILSGAQIFGAMGKKLLGGGESGPEAVLPLRSFYDELTRILDKRLGPQGGGATQFTQNNTYNSPRDLSPAECARQTRNETRKLLAAVRK